MLLTDEEILKEASKDSTYCQLSVDIGKWARDKTRQATLKEVGEYLQANVKGQLAIDFSNWVIRLIPKLLKGEMPE